MQPYCTAFIFLKHYWWRMPRRDRDNNDSDGEESSNSSSESNRSSSSSDDEADRFIPKSNRGWQGGDLELEHQRESFLEHKEKVSAAVDIGQFQNHEVGKGYQAKHVVRQKHAAAASSDNNHINNNLDATTKTTTQSATAMQGSKRKKEAETSAFVPDNPRTRLKKYLAAPGMVAFRRELEDILKS